MYGAHVYSPVWSAEHVSLCCCVASSYAFNFVHCVNSGTGLFQLFQIPLMWYFFNFACLLKNGSQSLWFSVSVKQISLLIFPTPSCYFLQYLGWNRFVNCVLCVLNVYWLVQAMPCPVLLPYYWLQCMLELQWQLFFYGNDWCFTQDLWFFSYQIVKFV